MKELKISIVIVNYNSGKHLSSCIESIKKNINHNYEVIIVDNNSNDGSIDNVCENNEISKIYNKKNLGFAKANNIGANKSTGEIIHFLNPDCILDSKINEVYNATFPNGIDYYHSNVCSERMIIALLKLNPQSHLILCGAMKSYMKPAFKVLGPNISSIVHKDAHIHGCSWRFTIDEWKQEFYDFVEENYEKLTPRYQVYEGIESMPQQYLDQFFVYDEDSNKKFGRSITQL